MLTNSKTTLNLVILLIAMLSVVFVVSAFAQDDHGTRYIPTDTEIGIWDAVTRTYTLTTDVYGTVQIGEDDLTLDGAGYTINALTEDREGNGIYGYQRQYVTIKNVSVRGFANGIYAFDTDWVNLSGNTFSDNTCGIRFQYTRDSTLTGNTATNNSDGIVLNDTWTGTLTSNTASSNSSYGIKLGGCRNFTLVGNTMSGNAYNFELSGPWEHDFVTNTIDTSNTVDGKPIYYVKNAVDEVYDSSTNAGTFYAINCDGITIKDLTIANNGHGVTLWKTKNSLIENVTSSDNYWIGIFLELSDDNTLVGNTVNSNQYGMYITHSSNNQVYNNNFIDNTRQVIVHDGSGNIFYLDKPIGGNYWSNHTSPDVDGDGFVDSPYGFDDFPLASPWDPAILVEIDIKPGSYPNSINLGSYGLVPVAILSSEEFDATTVDPETVELAGAGVSVRGKSNKYMAHKEDINEDGLLDLMVQVATENLEPESFQNGSAILTGNLLEEFGGTPIEGTDEITIVPTE